MRKHARFNSLYFAGAALVGLHIADDAFIQPQPGTGPADHLVSGLVPLVLLALGAWAYPRVRGGGRATIALASALLAVASAAEAIYYSGHGGLQGDDYTGLLALAAAPLLVGLGIAELWRSRRLDERHLRRYPRRVVKSLVIAFGVSLVALPFLIAYVGGHVSRSQVPTLDVPHQDAVLHTDDGLELRGWYVPSRNGAAVIVFPGRKGPLGRARMLARHGYGVLLYDRRGEGQSQGDPDSFGWDFNRDIRAGIQFLQHRPDVDPGRIAGIGLSVGGEMMLQTASETTDLAAVVAEGAGARTASEEIDDASGPDKVLAAISYGARDLTEIVVQGRMPPTNLKRLVPRIAPRPVLFLHAGNKDVGHLGPEYYRLAGAPKQIWQHAGGHTQGFATQPREYERRVVGFLDDALKVKQGDRRSRGAGRSDGPSGALVR